MITVINKPANVEFTLPTNWGEVTLKQFITLQKAVAVDGSFTPRSALEAFTSDINGLHAMKAADEARIIDALPFLTDMPDFLTVPVPTQVLGVTPPTELGSCTLFQKWCIQELLTELEADGEPTDFVSLAATVVSVYLYPLLTGQPLRRMSQLDEIADRINALPCTQALPLSAFFLRNWKKSTSSGTNSLIIQYPSTPANRSLVTRFRNWMRSWSTKRSEPLPVSVA